MHHGGPFPATTAPAHTSVGMTAIRRFLRPVAFQNAPAHVLPPELQDANPLGIWRRVDGELTRERARSVVHDAHRRRAPGAWGPPSDRKSRTVAVCVAERAAERIGRRRGAGARARPGASQRGQASVPLARCPVRATRLSALAPASRVTGSGRAGSEPSKSRWKDTPRV